MRNEALIKGLKHIANHPSNVIKKGFFSKPLKDKVKFAESVGNTLLELKTAPLMEYPNVKTRLKLYEDVLELSGRRALTPAPRGIMKIISPLIEKLKDLKFELVGVKIPKGTLKKN